jgi:hypothetical protein
LQLLSVGVLAAVLLAGCAAPAPPVQTRYIEERVTVPSALLTCAPAPILGTIKTQKDVGDFIIRLEAAGEDCRDTVSSIAVIETAPAGK